MTSETENECPMCGDKVVSESEDSGERVYFECVSCDFSVTL